MILTPTSFQTIVLFILREGDRQTYCNMYNDNPHFGHAGFDAYLIPDVGQQNINCDPARSGFDRIVFRGAEQVEVALVDDELKFDPSHRDALEYHFAALIAHISSRDP